MAHPWVGLACASRCGFERRQSGRTNEATPSDALSSSDLDPQLGARSVGSQGVWIETALMWALRGRDRVNPIETGERHGSTDQSSALAGGQEGSGDTSAQ